ncbi:MAG TPA: metalloregulator ArsR/SmtB family transcription factor [Thermodesulfobacteriota bacterium]|jgi:DNA-binding transcriptional ArsR family regulator|nr:metalloregulator ArsR/SmtB family transcription factor [Thermodesulfobacteriota bacterium]
MPKRIIKSVSELFGVLSNPTRLQIIILLNESEKDVKEIHERLGLSSSNASQHLAILRAHHLVDVRQEGVHVFYKLHNKKVMDIVQQALKFFEIELSEVESLRKALSKVMEHK